MVKKYTPIVFCIAFLFFPHLLNAQQKRLYIANDNHTDYMWTANEAEYDSAFVKMLDYYLFQIDSTKSNPSNYQARFNCDGSLWLKAYEKYRSRSQFKRLVSAIRSGHISSPLNMLVSCYGAQPTEAVIRGMYYAGQLEIYEIPANNCSKEAGKYSFKDIPVYDAPILIADLSLVNR